MNQPNRKIRTQVCRKYLEGHCSYGERCKFIHPNAVQYPPFLEPSPFMPSKHSMWHSYAYSPTQSTVPHLTPAYYGFESTPDGHFELGGYLNPPSHIPSPPAPLPNPVLSRRTNIPIDPQNVVLPNGNLYKPLSWRTTPCKHFAKNNGWCPLGDTCNFIHDLSLPPVDPQTQQATKGVVSHAPDPEYSSGQQQGSSRGVTGSASIPIRSSHCWSYVQGFCRVYGCRYYHPPDIRPYMKYTPCIAWPHCPIGDRCAYKHPEPVPSYTLMLSTIHPREPSPLSANDSVFFRGAQEVNGTTYFPLQPAPAPPPVPASPPQVYNMLSAVPRSWSMVAPELPPEQILEYVERGPYENLPGPLFEDTHASKQNSALEATEAVQEDTERRTSTAEHEFPYRPPKNQRVGHARRISVALKGTERETDSSTGTPSSSAPRMTHASRENRKSWAAFSSNERHFSSTELQFM